MTQSHNVLFWVVGGLGFVLFFGMAVTIGYIVFYNQMDSTAAHRQSEQQYRSVPQSDPSSRPEKIEKKD